MSKYLSLLSVIIFVLLISMLVSEPGFNGSNPGCAGSGCHDFKPGEVSVMTSELDVKISLPNISAG